MVRRLLLAFACCSVLWLCACGGGPTTPVKTTVTPRQTPVAPQVAAYPASIRKGHVELTPMSASVAKVSLKGILASGDSESDHFIFKVQVRNHSENKRVEFPGWPANQFMVNCSAKDEHDNAYKTVVFRVGEKIIEDQSEAAIEPGKEAVAVVPFEVPIPAAQSLTIRLNGDGVGMAGEFFEWKLTRSDWEHGKSD